MAFEWKNKLKKATFRGVPFSVKETTDTFGRSLVTHEFVDNEDVYTEDTGRRADRFEITGFVASHDYFKERDALIAALKDKTVGVLDHPYYGERKVRVETFSVRQGVQIGGMAEISMSFVEAGVKKYPNILINYKDQMSGITGRLKTAIKAQFIEQALITNVTEFVRQPLKNQMTLFGSTVNSQLSNTSYLEGIESFVLSSTDYINSQADLSGNLLKLATPSVTLMSSATSMADLLINTAQLITTITEGGRGAVSIFKNLFNKTKKSAVTSTSNNDLLHNTNDGVIVDFIQKIAIAEEANNMVTVDYESYDDAVEAREDLVSRIEAIVEVEKDPEVYDALKEVKKNIIFSVPGEDEELPRIRDISIAGEAPAIVLAYKLYEDFERQDDIILRNKVLHPGFVPASKELQVLTDG